MVASNHCSISKTAYLDLNSPFSILNVLWWLRSHIHTALWWLSGYIHTDMLLVVVRSHFSVWRIIMQLMRVWSTKLIYRVLTWSKAIDKNVFAVSYMHANESKHCPKSVYIYEPVDLFHYHAPKQHTSLTWRLNDFNEIALLWNINIDLNIISSCCINLSRWQR